MSQTYGDFSANGIAAIFPSRAAAHEAVHRLHESDIYGTWIGLIKTRADIASLGGDASPDERFESENWLVRVFGEGGQTLRDVLAYHGVGTVDSAALGGLVADVALVTVDGRDATPGTVAILERCGGRIIAGRETIIGTDGFDPHIGAEDDPVPVVPRLVPAGTAKAIREEIFFYDPAI